jgi:hypothetical protein
METGSGNVPARPDQGFGAVVSQLAGAFVRAVFVALLIALPSLLLPGVGPDTKDISMVFALVGAALTLFEYGSSHPGLVEFRFAPPFNRIRFVSLFLTVLLLAMMFRGEVGGGDITRKVYEIGTLVGHAMDFPFSPVRILTSLLTADATDQHADMVRSAAGISYVVSLLSLAFFAICMRLLSWPLGHGSFNVWVNLPTFDPASSFDVEDRLIRDSRVNIIFGFTLPFLMPLVAQVSSDYYDFTAFNSSQTLIWTVAVWAFLPASLFMRGIAMARIARLIRRKRQALHGPSTRDFAPA